MKWLSVKKHKPPEDIDEFFIISKTKELYIGWICDGITWVTEYGYAKDITHFCIPDPIEIEEE